MKKNRIIGVLALMLMASGAIAQDNMGIGTATPDPSAILELDANDKGFLVPRMTTQERTLIFQPATGLMVYDTDDNQFWYFDGTQWVQAVGGQGPQGPQGPTGVAGPAGADGADGATGPQGPQGPAGADGATGPQGPAGADGAPGVTGPAGPAGADGATGPAGPAGADGASGATGPAGPAGADGAPGATGPAGPAGADGAPGATGPAGPAGADGAPGATGPQGPQGIQGIQGPAGPAGPQGADGAQGPVGPQGPAGPAGADGADGAQGPTGPTGPAGQDGLIGPQGPQGPQGVQGVPGPQGPAGANGAQGPQGPAGPAGPAGAQGPAGPQGPQGVTGPTGPVNQKSGVVSTSGTVLSGSGYTVSNLSTGIDNISFSTPFSGGIPSVVVTSSSGVTTGPSTSLTTQFTAGNNFDGNMFDVIPSSNITVNDFDVNMDVGTANVRVYYKVGTHVGFETNAGAWTLLGTVSVNGAGQNNPTNLGLNLGLALNAGQTYAFYITNEGETNFYYTNGSAVGALAASNGDLQILQGTGKEYPFASNFTPRTWNGTIYYNAGSISTFTVCKVSNVNVSGFQCECVDLTGTATDSEYHFIATGN